MKNATNFENFKVAIRVRPQLATEITEEVVVTVSDEDERKIKVQKNLNCYEGYFDRVFSDFSTQKNIYNFVKEQLYDVLNGINSTILTYGQTGSGKTYTMFGSDWTIQENTRFHINQDKDNFLKNDFVINPFSEGNGVIPRCISKIFSEIESKKSIKITITCSFLQIYNEKIYDLLDETPKNQKEKDFVTYNNYNRFNKDLEQRSLNIRENKVSGIYVDGLTEYIVENVYDCTSILKKGETNRKKRLTKSNEMSSRSHTIFVLTFEWTKINKNGTLKKSKLSFCDLAGSEKLDQEDNYRSKHFSEMTSINLSLGTLGNVIQALANKQSHIPYRDSKLTRLLQNSLGGNTRTSFIVNIPPTANYYDETIATLKFADRAKSVFIKVQPNEILANDENMLKKLISEINQLKAILSLRKKNGNLADIETQYFKLKEENEKLKQFVKTNENIEGLIEENKMLKLELQKLKYEARIDENYRQDGRDYVLDKSNMLKIDKSQFENSLKGEYTGHRIAENGKNNIYTNLNLHNLKEIKMRNDRLKYLERLEKQNEMRLFKEIEKMQNARLVKKEEKMKKLKDNKNKIEKIEGHLNRLNYLYRDNNNIHSKYLIEAVNRNKYNKNIQFPNQPNKQSNNIMGNLQNGKNYTKLIENYNSKSGLLK